MKKYISTIIAFALVLTSLAVDNAKIVIVKKDNSTEVRLVELQKLNSSTTQLTIKKGDIPEDTKHIDIYAQNAEASTGEKGYWISGRGILGEFTNENGSYFISHHRMYLPYFGVKTARETFVAVIDGMRFEYEFRAEAANGKYKIFPRWKIADINQKPYEDINITFYKLADKDADYSGMARAYRRHKLAKCPDIKPIKERMKNSATLEKLANSMPIRLGHIQKKYSPKYNNKDFKFGEEPPIVGRKFSESLELLKKMKSMGFDDISVCVAGWQTGGYDGRCPAAFPVAEEAGGEFDLRALIKGGQDLGYIVDGHSNYTDCFTCSQLWSNNIVCKNPQGKFDVNGVWAGGRAYNLCLRNAWETFLQKDLVKIADLGFRGAHYIDVFSAVSPYRCFDKSHPATRKEQGLYQAKVLKRIKKLTGGAASECGFDHVAAQLDYINYVSANMRSNRNKPNPMITKFVPFWEIVYHGYILSNPDKITQEVLSQEDNLKLVEFGGRPIFYSVYAKLLPQIKIAYDQFLKLRHLQFETMESHKEIAENVFETTYGNDEKTIVNYTNFPYKYGSRTIKPKDFALVK